MNDLAEDYFSFTGFLDTVSRYISIVLMGLMTLTVVLQVLFRYIMKNPLIWTEELSRYLMIWMAFIAASSVLREWDTIRVDFIVNKLNERVRFVIKIINKTLVFFFCVLIFTISMKIYPKVSAHQLTSALQINMLIPQSGVIVGMLLMAVQTVSAIILDFKNRKIDG